MSNLKVYVFCLSFFMAAGSLEAYSSSPSPELEECMKIPKEKKETGSYEEVVGCVRTKTNTFLRAVNIELKARLQLLNENVPALFGTEHAKNKDGVCGTLPRYGELKPYIEREKAEIGVLTTVSKQDEVLKEALALISKAESQLIESADILNFVRGSHSFVEKSLADYESFSACKQKLQDIRDRMLVTADDEAEELTYPTSGN